MSTASPRVDERVATTSSLTRVLRRPELGAFLGAVVIYVMFALVDKNGTFATIAGTARWTDVAASTGIVAVPVALLMISGEFDLSSGVMIGTSGLLAGLLTTHFGLSMWPAILLTFAFAACIGLINGWLVMLTGLPSFIVFVLALVDVLRAGGRFTVWEDPLINNVATPIASAEIGALLGRAVDRGAEGVLHFAGGSAVTRRELAEATCRVFDLDPAQLDFGPPPDEARIPAPVPFDTSMSGARTMTDLGTQAWPIEDQLRSLRLEVDEGAPAPLS